MVVMFQTKIKREGALIEGEIVKKGNNLLLLDLGVFGVGRIYGIEYLKYKKLLDQKKVGEKIFAKILDIDDEDDFVDLTLDGVEKEIEKEKMKSLFREGEEFKMRVKKLLKNGAVGEIEGFFALLPKEQMEESTLLAFERGELLGQELKVKVLDFNEKKNTIVLTQKEFFDEIQVGKEVEGEVSSLSEFGVFVKIKDDLEAMIPILELPQKTLKVGQKVRAKIYKISGGKIYLTLK